MCEARKMTEEVVSSFGLYVGDWSRDKPLRCEEIMTSKDGLKHRLAVSTRTSTLKPQAHLAGGFASLVSAPTWHPRLFNLRKNLYSTSTSKGICASCQEPVRNQNTLAPKPFFTVTAFPKLETLVRRFQRGPRLLHGQLSQYQVAGTPRTLDTKHQSGARKHSNAFDQKSIECEREGFTRGVCSVHNPK